MEKTVESQGFVFHTTEDGAYWDESAYYEFNSQQIDTLEVATNDLHQMCLSAIQNIIDNKRYKELYIPEIAIPLIEKSWNEETPAIYGRFDLSYDGKSDPKMLEYNADTPTSLLEASVIQWDWMEDQNYQKISGFDTADQFNSIHEKLIDKWKELKSYLNLGTLYFTSLNSVEDYMNLSYMRDVANQAGIKTKEIEIGDIGWHNKDRSFVDLDMNNIRNIFKLYPWEWMFNEEFSSNLVESFNSTYWIEPPWKIILSNKGILPILWELNPDHKNLLPAYFQNNKLNKYVKKPFYSREGANITIFDGINKIETQGDYGEEGHIYQGYAPLPNFEGNYPVIGSWVIDGVSAGIGIRESNGLITDNLSRFIPHIFK